MRRSGWRAYASMGAVGWTAFFFHSCSEPDRVLDSRWASEIADVPRIQVGLSRFLRVPRAAVLFPERFDIVGPTGILAFEEGGQGPILLAWEGGLRIGGRVYPEASVRLTSGRGGEFELGGVRYAGDLIVRRDEREAEAPSLTLVNDVDLEEYLKGVVGKEMSLSAGEAALKAQVIAARTYALAEAQQKTLRRVRGEPFDVYDDERSQVYAGRERASERACRLVDETRGLFVMYQNKIFKTYYSSTCGGHTEPALLVLGERNDIPPLRGTPCGYCEESKYYRWKTEIPLGDVAEKLFGAGAGMIRDVRVTQTLPGGHAQEVAITMDGAAAAKRLHANDGFRRKLDPRTIRSTLWESVRTERGRLVIEGRGWGHAAGMCQWGAYKLAAMGKSAPEILTFYFPGARTQKLY
ncbi:MAG: SpoIID/LytB domain-containing protein [Planctomycetes bacterium]|nr:SpoIID/LytB domain-containing protein [Planctomycetota bacterium]